MQTNDVDSVVLLNTRISREDIKKYKKMSPEIRKLWKGFEFNKLDGMLHDTKFKDLKKEYDKIDKTIIQSIKKEQT